MSDLKKFSDEISKTGFVLENKVTQQLINQGWSVIANKYYEDDFEVKVREIDLIAYKVSKIQSFDVYTCLIISCKKNDSNVWALLSRDLNLKDPNIDWWPLHAWSNNKSIEYQLSSSGIAKNYYKEILKSGVGDTISNPDVDVFAFQEMNEKSGAPKNDKAIFDSITSLIKAQSYEMGVLPERKKDQAVYQFNLLSIVDAELVRLHFKDEVIEPKQITSQQFVSRYIINQKQSFSKIRFLNANFFADNLHDYTKLHVENTKWFSKLSDNFFSGIEHDNKRLNVYLDEFKAKIKWTVFSRIHDLTRTILDFNEIYLYGSSSDTLTIFIKADQEILSILNSDQEIQEKVKSVLEEIYRFSGKFIFEYDIPF